MKKSYLTAIAALLASSLTVRAMEKDYTVSANATLKDGSTVKGEFRNNRIIGSAIFADMLKLNPAIVKSIAFSGTNGASRVELVNGDKFAMTVTTESFAIKSLLGELNIPRNNFRSLAFSTRKISANGYDEGLVFYCTFDDEAAIRSPAVGPNGIFQKGEFLDGKNGQSLYLPAYTSGAKFTLPGEMIGATGTIEFWAKINEFGPLTDGGCPRFFEILAPEGKGEISHDWNANNGSGGSGLTFRVDGLPAMASSNFSMEYSSCMRSSYRRPPMTPPQGWHHYALVWGTNGIGDSTRYSAVVFIDGQRVLATPFSPMWQGPKNLSNGATLFFPNREDEMPDYARRAYTIDEFKIWNYAKTSFDL